MTNGSTVKLAHLFLIFTFAKLLLNLKSVFTDNQLFRMKFISTDVNVIIHNSMFTLETNPKFKGSENSNLFIAASTEVHQSFLGITDSMLGDKPTRTWTAKAQCKYLPK